MSHSTPDSIWRNKPNKSYLQMARYLAERHFMRTREQLSDLMKPIKIETPAPKLSLDHLQDLGNKCTVIYSMDKGYGDGPIRKQWIRGNIHTTDIDFRRYFHKSIPIDSPMELESRIRDVISFHLSLCEQFEEREKEFYPGSELPNYSQENGVFTVNREQWEFYKIKALCRAIIIIAPQKQNPSDIGSTDEQVLLVQTGVDTGLSCPISFNELEGHRIIGLSENEFSPDGTYEIFSTTMPKAVDFVMKLDNRESAAFPSTKDPRVVDHEAMCGYTKDSVARHGQDTTGPSTTWIRKKPDCEGGYYCHCQLKGK